MIVPLYVTLITSRVNILPLRTISRSRIPWRDSFFRIAFPTSLRTPLRVPIVWYLLFQFRTHVTFARLSFPLPFLTRVILERDARVFPSCFFTDLFTLEPVTPRKNLPRTRAIISDLVFAFRSLRLIIPFAIGRSSRSVAGKWPRSRRRDAICDRQSR